MDPKRTTCEEVWRSVCCVFDPFSERVSGSPELEHRSLLEPLEGKGALALSLSWNGSLGTRSCSLAVSVQPCIRIESGKLRVLWQSSTVAAP